MNGVVQIEQKVIYFIQLRVQILMEGGEIQMADKKEVVGKTEGIIVIVLAVVAFVLGMLAR
jgi:hypothetical protein